MTKVCTCSTSMRDLISCTSCCLERGVWCSSIFSHCSSNLLLHTPPMDKSTAKTKIIWLDNEGDKNNPWEGSENQPHVIFAGSYLHECTRLVFEVAFLPLGSGDGTKRALKISRYDLLMRAVKKKKREHHLTMFHILSFFTTHSIL